MLRHLRSLLPLCLSLTLIAVDIRPAATGAQSDPIDARISAIEREVEAKRQELGIPGLSLVVVKDDRVILQRGFGQRDVARNLPVTPETLFAIGSCTKAFTAMAAVISADEGRLSLDDPPRKHLAYFRLSDPEADAKITVRDLLYHDSGLDRTDISWYSGRLNREEVIRVAAIARPTAKFREKFQYQNTMYSAAGEVVARANHSTWERVIADRFFAPLGMKASNTSVREMRKSSDYALGYNLREKQAEWVPTRDLTNIAAAGAINSNARDMAQWVRLMLGGGVFEGKRFVSEKGFRDILTKHIAAGGGSSYGLGWGLTPWKGTTLVAHSGGIDGFNSYVALLPDHKIGFALLTNVTSSPVALAVREAIWKHLIAPPEKAATTMASVAIVASPTSPPETEAGVYLTSGLKIDIVWREGKLYGIVAGQPEYPLANVGGRRYKLGSPAPDGFYMTFRPVADRAGESEMYLEQPHGNVKLLKQKTAAAAVEAPKFALTVDELMAKAIASAGGEENLRRHRSMVITGALEFPQQGLTGEIASMSKAPNLGLSLTTLIGLGKKLGTIREYFDGATGGTEMSFSPPEVYTDKRLDDVRLASDFYGPLNWKTNFKEVRIKEMSKVGDEDAYVVVKTPEKGNPVTDYISAHSFLLLRRDRRVTTAGGAAAQISETYSDYRETGGLKLPFHTLTKNPGFGEIIMRVKEVKFDIEIPDAKFRATPRK